jgi:FkbM family methyltransferase
MVEAEIETNGMRLTAPLRLDSDDWIALVQVWIEPEYAWPDIRPETILDAGGNCGFASVALARRYPGARLAVLEPELSNAEALRRTLARNAVHASVVEAALTEKAANVSLRLSGVSGAHTVLEGFRDGGREAVDVPGRTVEGLMRDLGWDRIGLLKIDVEGYEKVLFRENCEWLANVDAIVGELHGDYDLAAAAVDLGRWGLRVTGQGSMFTARRE